MGPILLVDKSTVQALNPAEITFMHKHYMVVIAPILMRELLSNLAKETINREETERRLSALAAKVGMYDSKVVVDARSIAGGNLLGHEMPMDGRIPMGEATWIRSKDGRTGVIFDEPPEKKVLREWKCGKFTADEKEAAQQIRKIDLEVDLNSIKDRISKDLCHFPKFHAFKDLVAWIDETFLPLTDQRNHITSAASSVLPLEAVSTVISRWKNTGEPPFSDFAPYAYYFYRCNLIYYLGLGQGFVSSSKNQKTHLDIQYLYYLPFCMAFTSGDNFLRDMFPYFRRENQFFVWQDDLKKDLIAIKSHWDGLNEEEKQRFVSAYGDYPPEISGSVTGQLWKRLMRPKPQVANLGPNLTKEQLNGLAKQITSLYSEAVRIEDNKSVDAKFTEQFADKDLKQRSFLLLKKCIEVFGLNDEKNWSHVKKEICPTHVREIYDFYADLWRPDTDWLGLSTPTADKQRVLYIGDVDPALIVRNALASTLYFDEICIVDPFVNPWTMTEEYNPISHPNQFQADLLKVAYVLFFLWPWIESGQVVFIPDPSNLNLSLKKDMLNIARATKKTWKLNEDEKKEAQQYQRLQRENLLRFIRTLPEVHQRRMLKGKLPATEIDEFITTGLTQRAEDPLAIDRSLDRNEGQLYLSRWGTSLELSLLLSQSIGAIPLSTLLIRANQYRKLKSPPPHRWAKFCDVFNRTEFDFFDVDDPSFVNALKANGFLSEFRTLLRTLISRLSSNEEIADSEIDVLTEELESQITGSKQEWAALQKAMEKMANDVRLDCDFRKGKLILDIDDRGYTSAETDKLRTKHFPELIGCPPIRTFFHVIP